MLHEDIVAPGEALDRLPGDVMDQERRRHARQVLSGLRVARHGSDADLPPRVGSPPSRRPPPLMVALVSAALGAAGVYLGPRLVDGGADRGPAPAIARPVRAPVLPPPGSALQASGFVVANRQATVSAEVTGRLVELDVAEGAKVRRGQVIARLSSVIPRAEVELATAQVASAQREADVTRAQIAAAQTVLGRRETLAERGFVTRASLDEARDNKRELEARLAANLGAVDVARRQVDRSRRQLETTTVVAPFDGVVNSLSANIGEIVSPISAGGGFTRTGIGTVVDLRSLAAEVELSEQYLSQVHEGDRVRISLLALPAAHVNGTISTVTAAVDRSTAAVRIRIKFELNTDRHAPRHACRRELRLIVKSS